MMDPDTCENVCPIQPGLHECGQGGTVKSGFSVFYLNGLFRAEMWIFKPEAYQVLQYCIREKVGVGRVEKKGGRLPLKVTNGEKDM